MKRFLFALCILQASSAFALLPPFYQSTRELEAILADEQLAELLGTAEMIQEIRRIEGGYLILTQHRALQVNVRYLPTRMIGPGSFVLEYGEPKAISF